MQKFLIYILVFFIGNQVQAQICLGEDTTVCPGESVTISLCPNSGNPGGVLVLDSMQQVNLSDDQYSGAVNIGFPFTFYGNVYTQVVIASNNYITFDVSQAGGYSPWSIGNAAPSPALPLNVVMGPYQDINPGLGGTIEYGIVGNAPNRMFVVRYNQVPMFSCTNDLFCSSLILFEGSNNIEVHIDNKPLCPTWNGGVAIEGVQDQTGSNATVTPGRNFPTQWTASADGYQFTPNGPTNYLGSTVAYMPSLLGSGIQWWDTNGNLLGSGFDISVTPTNDTTGYYIVYDQCYTGSGGPTNSDTSWVYLHDLPQIVTTKTTINCNNPTAIAVANASGNAPFTYLWDDPMAQTNDTAFGLTPGTYTVVVTDTNGCDNQAVVTIDSAAYTHSTASIQTLCNGDSSGIAYVTTIPSDTIFTYLWDDPMAQTNDTATGLSSGNYSVFVTDTAGCIDTIAVFVNEPSAIMLTDTIINPTCNGSANGSIAVNASGGTPGYTYSWGSNQLNGLAQGTYAITVTDSNNCIYTDSFTLTEPAPLIITLDTNSASCGLNDGMIWATVQGGTPGYSYNWNPGGNGNDTLDNIGTGMYYLTVIDSNGCTANDSIFVNEINNFSANFTLTPSTGVAPLEVFFTNNSINCVTYYWDFGNGDTSTVQNPPSITYINDSTYIVTLIACNAGGCCDTISQTVLVESNSICSFANVFTPNGDGMNDKFDVNCDKIVEYNIVIFNRWGNKLFESNDIDNPWDGTNKGKEVPEGTYFFIIKAIGLDDVVWNKKGSISLIR